LFTRLVNWVHLKDRSSGREFRYWNTHLDHRGQKAREHGAAMIVQASAVLPENFPQLLTGDMNSHAANPAIKHFKSAGWVDTYAAVNGPKDPGFTAHGFKGMKLAPENPDGTPKTRIDWIFCRGPVKPLAAAVIRDSRNGHYPSDHFFISAEVEL
jgi:endonuclease/exonuclease/phosphatase family metal-dependent hydrolase